MVLHVGSGLFFLQESCCPFRKYQSRSKAHWHPGGTAAFSWHCSSCCWQDRAWTPWASSSVVLCTGAKHCGYSQGKAGSWRTQMPSSGLDFCSFVAGPFPGICPGFAAACVPVCRAGLRIRLLLALMDVRSLFPFWIILDYEECAFMTHSSPGTCLVWCAFTAKKGGFLSNYWPLLARKLMECDHSSSGRKI